MVNFYILLTNSSFWGFYLGRPFRMNAGDVSVSKPASGLGRAREETWYAYGMGESQPPNLKLGLGSPSELISRQFANLWEMITPVGHILLVLLDLIFLECC
jgi:hypothetical protein